MLAVNGRTPGFRGINGASPRAGPLHLFHAPGPLPLIEAFAQLGDLVLDPFAGCGSTPVAAAITGRRYLGVELDQQYCEIARHRLVRLEHRRPRPVRHPENAWMYYETASLIVWKKHKSYARRGLFANPIALVLHSSHLPLFDIRRELSTLVDPDEFERTGFAEVWAIDLSDAYYTPGHPFRRADMFCFKPTETFGLHRIGDHGRKPYG